jgi:hypothetical protein
MKRPAAVAVFLALALALGGLACSSRPGAADGSAAPVTPIAPSAPGPAAAPAALPDDLEPAAADDRSDAGTVKIKLIADPRRQAHVYWGRKDLGIAPIEIVRPRGSAPLDLTILAPECLPFHTRAFTDRDDTLSLRLYTEREASGLPGYSAAPIPPSGPTKTQRQF